MTEVFVTIIVPADSVESARAQAATVNGGAGMFTCALSPTGNAPATHYISSGFVSQELATMFDYTDLPPQEAMAAVGLQMVSE